MFCVPSFASVRRQPAANIPERMQFTLACVVCGRPTKGDLQITIGLRSNKITPNSRWGHQIQRCWGGSLLSQVIHSWDQCPLVADLCRSLIRRVLVKSNASAWIARMQFTGQWQCKYVLKWAAIPHAVQNPATSDGMRVFCGWLAASTWRLAVPVFRKVLASGGAIHSALRSPYSRTDELLCLYLLGPLGGCRVWA